MKYHVTIDHMPTTATLAEIRYWIADESTTATAKWIAKGKGAFHVVPLTLTRLDGRTVTGNDPDGNAHKVRLNQLLDFRVYIH